MKFIAQLHAFRTLPFQNAIKKLIVIYVTSKCSILPFPFIYFFMKSQVLQDSREFTGNLLFSPLLQKVPPPTWHSKKTINAATQTPKSGWSHKPNILPGCLLSFFLPQTVGKTGPTRMTL